MSFLFVSSLTFLFVSCASLNPNTVQLEDFKIDAAPSGTLSPTPLVRAEKLFVKSASDWATILTWASPDFLSSKINPKNLVDSGYNEWRAKRKATLHDVQAFKLVFNTQLLPASILSANTNVIPDRQSGLLLLPAANKNQKQKLTWVIWTKGTDLERKNAPSAYASGESQFAAMLASLGYAVWMPDYAGFGESAGVQTYCVPESQALSSADGLRAARTFVATLKDFYEENGRLTITGYSQGGLAAMASARYITENRELFSGLNLDTVWSLAAPLDLMIGARTKTNPDTVLSRPEYTFYLVLGWARAYPEIIKPQDVLKTELVEKIAPLFDGTRENTVLHEAIAKAVGKPFGSVSFRDIFSSDYLSAMETNPESVPYYRMQSAARLDMWVPEGSTRLVLAASLKDLVVSPENAFNAKKYILSRKSDAKVDFVELYSSDHGSAGGEALLYAILQIDKEEQLRNN